MPRFNRDGVSIHYEESGRGHPLLLLAPGGMRSEVGWWQRAALNPFAAGYAADFLLVAMDQRNAGQSSGPLDLADPWGSYADDQLALMDHLGHRSFHVLGCCIGCSYALKLIERAPDRVTAAVLQQPIGFVDDNRALFEGMWRDWAREVLAQRADLAPEAMESFGTAMWVGRDFVGSVSREFVCSVAAPLLVLPGVDDFHPTAIGREVAQLAPNAEVLEPWKDSEALVQQAVERVRDFLREHTPAHAV
jgi:pimeloyl-ACP methyl ester carboxylesterase